MGRGFPLEPRTRALSSRRISAYGAAGGKGARNHLSRAHGIFLSAVFFLSRGEPVYILVGQQGQDACPGVSGASGTGAPWATAGRGECPGHAAFHLGATQGSPESQLVCLGEFGEHAMTDGTERIPGWRRWAGGGGGGGGATYIFRVGARGAVASTPSWVSQAPLSLWAPGAQDPDVAPDRPLAP